ncbi:hypothetical protein JTB14_017093 [Gonioctena quinquepunctata]|nr:hypothetical protein JTB14_017093 [Gonioctena quinquepunctata]
MASRNETPPIRKTMRTKKPSLKALESLNTYHRIKSVQYSSSDDDESEDSFHDSDVEKPKILHDDEIIQGKNIFQFQSRKTKDALALKVAEAQKTPHAIRQKARSRIAKIIEEDSESEYEVSSEESSESSEGEISSNIDSDVDDNAKTRKNHSECKDVKLAPSKARSHNNYTIKSDEYFENFTTSKVKTSSNTLDKLKTPRLPQYQLQTLLRNMKLSEQHEEALTKLSYINENCFRKWLFLLNENFNILLYGLGSKRDILNKFHMHHLKNVPVVVVNGFFPTLTIKNVLDSIITDLLELDNTPTNPVESCDTIIKELKRHSDIHLYLIVHNIEGECLRNGKSQNILARLASAKNVHLIASIDHINAPLIWDHSRLSKFNFIWWDVTSFLPYNEETSFERSMMVQQSGTLALSSLKNVFQSLTTNSKSIYTLIVKHQLENTKNQYYQGLAFKDLYMACRESFIVSSDLALRGQLTEFVDHKMVKLKRSQDGTEYLMINLPNELLQKFLDEMS